jgi:TonB family protein
VKEHYLNDTLKETATYSDAELSTKDGSSQKFFQNGQKFEEGFFKAGARIGQWTRWYKNGQIQEVSIWSNAGDFDQRERLRTFYDSVGNVMVENGAGEYILTDESPAIEARGQLQGGLKTGKWIGHYKNGDVAFEEEYDNNRLITGVSYDTAGRKYKYDKVLDSNMLQFYGYIAKNLKYPAEARRNGTQGMVFVHLVTDSEGKIVRTRVVKGIGRGCDEEAIRVVTKFSGNLFSGKKRGQPIKPTKPQSMYLPIAFKMG